MNLRCFVAMAIGQDDTDKFYDARIKRPLKAIGISAIRVDKIEHNNNIDAQIMSEIRKCDIAIADLTYARPSAYFEAGYAESRVPVVYTCRGDHFKPAVDDSWGNKRVHFDLQMRNILQWKNPNDVEFTGKLIRRIKKVISPILKSKEQNKQRTDEDNRFARLSPVAQNDALFHALKSVVNLRNIKIDVLKKEGLVAAYLESSAIYLLKLSIVNQLKPKQVMGFGQYDALFSARAIERLFKKRDGVSRVESLLILSSAKKLPQNLLPVAFPNAHRGEMSEFIWEDECHLYDKKIAIPISVRFFILDSIRSPANFMARLKQTVGDTRFLRKTT